jgi:guanylate kinase
MAREEIAQQEIDNRMRTAEKALDIALGHDYYSFVINDDVSGAADKVDAIAHGRGSSDEQRLARQIAEDLLEKVRHYLSS